MDDFAAGDEAGDRIGVTDDVDGAIPDLLGGFVDDDLSAIDDDDVLDEIGDLIDEVAREHDRAGMVRVVGDETVVEGLPGHRVEAEDRKSTRLNSSHVAISYAVFCLKKKS